MAAWSEMSVGARVGAVAGVAALVVAILWGAWSVRPAPQEPAVTEAAPAAEPVAEATPAPTAAAEATPAPEATPEPVATEATPEASVSPEAAASDEAATAVEPAAEPAPETAAVPVPPVFDLVRVERDGTALVAGSAAAGAGVSLRIDGAEILAVPADGAGKFVAMFNLAPSTAPRMLGMVMRLADGTEVASTQTVAIAPTLAPAAQVADVAADGAAADGAAAATPAPAEPVAPATLLVTEEGAKVLQSPEALPEMAANVTVDSISYTADGDVQLAGRGLGGSVVRVYLDNRQVGDGLIDQAGSWGLTLTGIAPGIYTMRVDQLDGSGKVTSRFETPFKRETVEALAAAAEAATAEAEPVAEEAAAGAGASAGAGAEAAAGAPAAEGPVSVTVQPGFTLWRIARETLGEGVMYVQVFEANKGQIRDPNLIYPGQVFTIPKP